MGQRIVIVGGGFAGAYCARELERRLPPAWFRKGDGREGGGGEIILLDRNNYFPFYPLLIEAGTGGLEPRHAVVAIRSMIDARRTRFVMAEVRGADLQRGTITFRRAESPPERPDETEPFDHLVLAMGSITSLPPPSAVPGLAEHAYPIKSIAEAVAIRDRVIRMLEAAAGLKRDLPPEEREALIRRLLHFVVVGGNFTGAEMAGELDSFLHQAVRRHYPGLRGRYKVTLVERGPRILEALGPKLGDYAAANLRRRGVDVLLNTSAVEIGPEQAVVSILDFGSGTSILDFGSGILDRKAETAAAAPHNSHAPAPDQSKIQNPKSKILSTRTVIWAAGIAPPPLVKRLNVPVNAQGYIVCERDGRVRGFDHIWAIGDIAVNPLPTDARGYPATAQHAIREGRAVARNIARVIVGGEGGAGQGAAGNAEGGNGDGGIGKGGKGRSVTRPIDSRSQGSLAALGRRTGVADLYGVKISGFAAWWLWRTVYLLKMPGAGRRTRIALDWTLDLLFKSDTVQLGIHPPPAERGEC